MANNGSSTGVVPVIRMVDPAVDVQNADTNSDWNRYVLTRDPALFPKILKSGEKPTVFHIRKAVRSGVRYIRAGADEAEKYERAFAVCVTRVDGLRVGDRRTDIDVPDTGGASPMADAILERFAESDIQEIGSVALGMSFLAHDLPAYYPPPAISWHALRALTSRPAAPTSDDTTSSSPPSSE